MKTITLQRTQFEVLPAFIGRMPVSSEVIGMWKFQDGRRPGWVVGQYLDGQIVLWNPNVVDNDVLQTFESNNDIINLKKPFVLSSESVNVAYEGGTLKYGGKCYWKVRVWDKDDKANEYSEPATFEMGLLDQYNWEGKWIGADVSISSPLLRKEFEITKEIKCARVYISGIGWHELYINGKKIGDHVLDPATTDYNKRVLYVTMM